jgi:hypothetical protein
VPAPQPHPKKSPPSSRVRRTRLDPLNATGGTQPASVDVVAWRTLSTKRTQRVTVIDMTSSPSCVRMGSTYLVHRQLAAPASGGVVSDSGSTHEQCSTWVTTTMVWPCHPLPCRGFEAGGSVVEGGGVDARGGGVGVRVGGVEHHATPLVHPDGPALGAGVQGAGGVAVWAERDATLATLERGAASAAAGHDVTATVLRGTRRGSRG